MNQDATIALFNRCEVARKAALTAGKDEDRAHYDAKSVWNDWAYTMIEERKKLEKDNGWEVAKDEIGETKPTNNATHAWMEAAAADFSVLRFWCEELTQLRESIPEHDAYKSIVVDGATVRFDGFVFPGTTKFERAQFFGETRFAGAQFLGDTYFTSATVFGPASFVGTKFSEAAWFVDALFVDEAWFAGAKFSGNTWFTQAEFSEDAHFRDAQFFGVAMYRKVQFSGDADFATTHFLGGTQFWEAQFCKEASFAQAQFSDAIGFLGTQFFGDARFNGVTFRQLASFSGAHFYKCAILNAIRSGQSFSLEGTRFAIVPDFVQAHFEEAPRLDDMRVGARLIAPLPLNEPNSEAPSNNWVKLKLILARWRAYVIRTVKGIWNRLLHADQNLPACFRALRRLAIQGHDHENERVFLKGEIRARRCTVDYPWHAAFWFGLGYELLSDFGGSIARPVYWGTASVLAFAVVYSRFASGTCGLLDTEAFGQALFVSLENAILLISWDSIMDGAKAPSCFMSQGASIWPTLSFGAVQIMQRLWSAVLWFLLILAVRNRFRIS